ncbi:hypothetical protein Msil_2769 [Methylocella silvestris BL2]|uniref:Uncharacterized protein n=2 Tax=Methylocella silvestris TaxID=199596 RepID=B8ERZ1_METSB|nr:hypothetical protein Msil_2769 [Methylocella silvestris BL2]
MTQAEALAYNAGVRATLDYAKLVAQALSADPSWKPTRIPFAADALDEFAEAAQTLFIPMPPNCAEDAIVAPPFPTPQSGGTETPASTELRQEAIAQ